MRNFGAHLIGLILAIPFPAFAILGMNAGANLQGARPAWTKQLGTRTQQEITFGKAITTDSSGNIFVAGTAYGDLNGNTMTGGNDLFVIKYDSTGATTWTRQLGVTDEYTYGYGVATDSSGNVIIAGYTTGGVDGNTRTGYEDLIVTKYNSSGTKLWTKQLGVASTYTHANAVATDSSGNIFVAGYTTGGLDGNTKIGNNDFFVTKYDASGTKVWTKQLGVATKDTYANGVATDSSGNIFVAGYTTGGLDGNTKTGNNDYFVTKYDSTGAKIWTKQLGVTSKSTYSYGVATDSSGNIFVAGYTNGGLGGNTLTGSYDFFVTRYDSTGAKIWTKQLGVATKSTYGNAVTTDSSGNIMVAGYTNGGLDGNTLTGSNDFFVTQYNSSGTKVWTKQLGVASQDTQAYGVTADSSGNVFVAGYTSGGLDGNTLTGTDDLFVTKYNSSGTKSWTKQLGGLGPSATYSAAAASDSSDNLYLVGYTQGSLAGNTLTGTADFFVTKYNSTGATIWTRQLGVATKGTYGNAAATDSSGNVFVAGYTTGGLDGNTLTGTGDLFITKYNSSGTKSWTKQLGVASNFTQANAVATDSSGNIFVAGYTTGGLDGNTLTGSNDFFVTKYDSTGAKVWTKQLGVATKSTYANGVATDSSGNIFVAGYTTGGLDGNTLTGSNDFFVTKYDSTGAKIWTKQLGVASQNTYGKAVATDSSGNIMVAGYTTGGLDGNTLTGTTDFFLTKYDSSGTKVWTKQLGVTSQDTYSSGVATDGFGNVFVAGESTGALDGNSLTGSDDVIVTKYTSAGVRQWTKQMGSSAQYTWATAITVTSSGRVYVVGTTSGGLDFTSQVGSNDAFSCQYIGN